MAKVATTSMNEERDALVLTFVLLHILYKPKNVLLVKIICINMKCELKRFSDKRVTRLKRMLWLTIDGLINFMVNRSKGATLFPVQICFLYFEFSIRFGIDISMAGRWWCVQLFDGDRHRHGHPDRTDPKAKGRL